MTQGRKTLLVGINEYDDQTINDLRCSVNDASSIHNILTNPKRGAFTPDNSFLITDKNQINGIGPTRSNLMSSIQSLSDNATSDDYVLFFFSGHGIEENGQSYLLPSDASMNVLCDTAIPIDWIKSTLKSSAAPAKILILDACHASAMKGKASSGRMTKGLSEALLSPIEGFAVLSSCKLNEVSYEMPHMKHSVFSHFLIEGLKGAADFDSDGHITVSDVSRYTADKTKQWAYKQHRKQTPNLESHVVGDLALVDVPRLVSRKVGRQHRKTRMRDETHDLDLPIDHVEVLFMDASAPELNDNICTCLAQHFDLDQITVSQANRITFPLGVVSEGSFILKYRREKLSKIDELFIDLVGLFGNINYLLVISKSEFDLKKVSEWVKKTGGKILQFSGKQSIETKKQTEHRFLEVVTDLGRLKEPANIAFYNFPLRRGQHARSSGVGFSFETFNKDTFNELRPSALAAVLGDLWRH